MIGFDWPFQFANCSGGIGLVPDFFTCSPAIFGRASVAFTMQGLTASAAAQLNAGTSEINNELIRDCANAETARSMSAAS